MNVAVAFQVGNEIPQMFGDQEEMISQRFEIDSEDGTIYTRSTIRSLKSGFVQDIIDNKADVFVYNKLDPELENGLLQAGIRLVSGVSGNTIKAALDVATKE